MSNISYKKDSDMVKYEKQEARRKREEEKKVGHLRGDFCQPNDPRIDS